MPKILEPVLTPKDAPWGRQVNDRLLGHDSSLARLESELKASEKGLAASLSALSGQIQAVRDVVNAMPITRAYSETASGFAITSSWATRVSTTFSFPEGKTRAAVTCLGTGSLYVGGVTTPVPWVRVRTRVNGVVGVMTYAEWDYDASGGGGYIGPILAAQVLEVARPSSGNVTIDMQFIREYDIAFPSSGTREGTISASVTFT